MLGSFGILNRLRLAGRRKASEDLQDKDVLRCKKLQNDNASQSQQ